MAPLNQATRTKHKETLEDGSQVFECIADKDWTVGVVTFGGYSLGLVVDASSQYQAKTTHPDIVHLSSQFLRATTPGPIEIKISKVRTGNQFTNLAAEIWQMNALKATSQLIFGNFDQLSTSAVGGVSLPDSHKPLHPLVAHPSQSTSVKPHWAQRFTEYYFWSKDPYFTEKNGSYSSGPRDAEGMQTGTWIRMNEPVGVKMSPAYIPFFVDMIHPPWDLLPGEHTQGRKFWFPSLSINIEFKCRLPLSSDYASHTMALFGRKRHLNDGVWSDSTEIWTAPSELGDEAEVDEKWREKMVCVAVGNQVAYMASPDVNKRYETGAKSKL